LSWTTILKKREGYRAAFDNFEIAKVASYDEDKIDELVLDPRIIRNRRKIESTVGNSRAIIDIQKEFGSLDSYLWAFVDGKPIRGGWKALKDLPSATLESKRMSSALLEMGLKFVGPTICYAFMQAVGMANDHTVDCYRYSELSH
jgi:DNA-3-methyladenine glycosylase I